MFTLVKRLFLVLAFLALIATNVLTLAAIPGETLPIIGTALLIAGTSYELYAACDNMKDLDELYSDMGMADEVPDDVLHSVCDPSLPDP